MLPVILGLRGFQLFFGAVILGLSVTLAKGQTPGHKVPATTGYGSFCGAFALIASLVGIATALVSAVPDIVSWAVDGLTVVLLIAGGIAFAVGLKGVNCSHYNLAMAFNDMLNCGFVGKKDPKCPDYECGPTCKAGSSATGDYMMGRCRTATADEVFLFLACVVTAVALAFSFVTRGKGGRSGYAV